MKLTNTGLAIIFLCLVLTAQAQAHKVIVFAWVEDGMIRTESGFGSKRPAKNCEINVYTRGTGTEKILVNQGRTNENGKYDFKVSDLKNQGWQGKDIEIHLNAGPGHAGQWTITASELEIIPGGDLPSIKDKVAGKEFLNKDPSPLKISLGIILIFALAFVLGRIKKSGKKTKGTNAG